MERAVASEFAPTAFCRRARHRRSNREPCVHDLASDGSIVERHPVSGLVTALDPVLRATSGTWIAHGSDTADRGTADAFDRVQIAGDGEVFRFYRTADACHVNSLDDGMNVVAKEFVAARDDGRRVVVLSEFAGSARSSPARSSSIRTTLTVSPTRLPWH
jgi:trehalose-6-phosphate synthase